MSLVCSIFRSYLIITLQTLMRRSFNYLILSPGLEIKFISVWAPDNTSSQLFSDNHNVKWEDRRQQLRVLPRMTRIRAYPVSVLAANLKTTIRVETCRSTFCGSCLPISTTLPFTSMQVSIIILFPLAWREVLR
jgi:hypothetical protein